jgi:hypothetical protein
MLKWAFCIFIFTSAMTESHASAQYARSTVHGTSLLVVRSGGAGSCNEQRASDCVTPQKHGQLVVGSGHITEMITNGDAFNGGGTKDVVGNHHIGWWVTKDTPEEICVQIFARTGGCPTGVSIQGRVAATERYRR